jgi:hypothetical protein
MASGNLGQASAIGILGTSVYQNRITAGAWVVRFKPDALPRDDFEVWHGFANGPGGYFFVYIDDAPFGVGENGRINEYTPVIPMFVRKGQEISLHWSIATTPAPQVWLYFRQPEVGKI